MGSAHKIAVRNVEEHERIKVRATEKAPWTARGIYTLGAVLIVGILLGGSLSMMISADTPTDFSTVLEPGSMVSEYDYIIFESDGVYYARNGMTGEVEFSGDSVTVMAAVQTALGAEGGVIYSMITHEALDLRTLHVTTHGPVYGGTYPTWNSVYSRVGAGRISFFSLIVGDSAWQAPLCRLNIAIDGVATVVNFGTLACAEFPYMLATVAWKMSWTSVNAGAAIQTSYSTGNFWMTYPINFKTSCYINFTSMGGAPTMFSTVWARHLDTNPVSTHMAALCYDGVNQIAPGEHFDMVNRTGHSGRFLAVHLVLRGFDNLSFLENNPTLVVDGSSISSTGTEDFFNSAWYYVNSVLGEEIYDGPYAGCPVLNYDYNVSCQYRNFWGEMGGIAFQDSFRFFYPNNESYNTIQYSYWVLWEEYT